MAALSYSLVHPAAAQTDPSTVAPYMFWLMFRNIASDDLVFTDPVRAGVLSRPGCVLASPSWANPNDSEQFDAATGYEKSVANLSWSYASYLSAVRARGQT
jgi:hypothetical protein